MGREGQEQRLSWLVRKRIARCARHGAAANPTVSDRGRPVEPYRIDGQRRRENPVSQAEYEGEKESDWQGFPDVFYLPRKGVGIVASKQEEKGEGQGGDDRPKPGCDAWKRGIAGRGSLQGRVGVRCIVARDQGVPIADEGAVARCRKNVPHYDHPYYGKNPSRVEEGLDELRPEDRKGGDEYRKEDRKLQGSRRAPEEVTKAREVG